MDCKIERWALFLRRRYHGLRQVIWPYQLANLRQYAGLAYK